MARPRSWNAPSAACSSGCAIADTPASVSLSIPAPRRSVIRRGGGWSFHACPSSIRCPTHRVDWRSSLPRSIHVRTSDLSGHGAPTASSLARVRRRLPSPDRFPCCASPSCRPLLACLLALCLLLAGLLAAGRSALLILARHDPCCEAGCNPHAPGPHSYP